MLNIVNAELHHVKGIVRTGQEYFNESRFSKDTKLDENTWHETAKSCIVAPNVMIQVLEDEDKKVHGFVQAALSSNGWNDKLTCAVHLIFVDECCRGKNYAEQFLTNVKEWAKANNCYEIIAGDYAFNPEATAKWYAKQGYTTVGQQYGLKL
jgi:GNAT superfamily N-acetyltransferase